MSKYRIGTYFGNNRVKLVVTDKTTAEEVKDFDAPKSVKDLIRKPNKLTKRVRDKIAKQEEEAEKKAKK